MYYYKNMYELLDLTMKGESLSPRGLVPNGTRNSRLFSQSGGDEDHILLRSPWGLDKLLLIFLIL